MMKNSQEYRSGKFAQASTITFFASVLNLIIGIIVSIIIARLLGPEGKGVYTLATLLPAMIVALCNFGIGPATVYHVAQGQHPKQAILGNNIVLSTGFGANGVIIGLIVIIFFRESVLPGVTGGFLFIALAIIPLSLFLDNINNIMLGSQNIEKYNLITILRVFLTFIFLVIALWVLKAGVMGALFASIFSQCLTCVAAFFWAKKISGGVSFKLNFDYLRKVSVYGIQAHLSNVLAFINYRLDMFLINGFLNPLAVGFYSISVSLVEKLWMVSSAASTVLFPKIAAETDELKRKELTPIVARTVLWITTLGALVIFLLSRWIVELLFSTVFLPSVKPLKILLPGIVALSVSRILANDIAGRGRPILNTYVSMVTVATNVILNILWIPKYGISGAALASTVSYSMTFLARLFLYCQISQNSWMKIILPQKTDWEMYWRTGAAILRR